MDKQEAWAVVALNILLSFINTSVGFYKMLVPKRRYDIALGVVLSILGLLTATATIVIAISLLTM